MKIKFTPQAQADLEFWKRTDKKTALKILSLIEEICQTPYTGRGKPGPLKYALSGYWSRRINLKDRLVYKVEGDHVILLILAARGHY